MKTKAEYIAEALATAADYIRHGFDPRGLAHDEFGLECHYASTGAVKWSLFGAIVLGVKRIKHPRQYGGIPNEACVRYEEVAAAVRSAIVPDDRGRSALAFICDWETESKRTQGEVLDALERAKDMIA